MWWLNMTNYKETITNNVISLITQGIESIQTISKFFPESILSNGKHH